jgi:hypothetical protein
VIATEPVTRALPVSHLDPDSQQDAVLEVVVQGVTQEPHQVSVSLNGVLLGPVGFLGQEQGVARFSVLPASLQEGDNVVRLVSEGGPTDVSLVDRVRLSYPHRYTAEADRLRFTVEGGQVVKVGGFSTGRIRVMDVTEPDAVRGVAAAIGSDALGYVVSVVAPGAGTRTLFAFTEAAVEQPAEIVANEPSAWHRAGMQGEMVVISHKEFIPALYPLLVLRKGQGWSVAVVDVQDIYDEWSFGAKSPYAIRDFLAQAQSNWRQPPRFVLLVGDASFDPRNYLGLGDFDLVPTKLVDTAFLETASDDWFGDFSGGGLAAVGIGRLPVRTATEAVAMVGKIVGYEGGGGAREVVLVADRNDSFDFEGASAAVEALLPGNATRREIFVGALGDSGARSQLLTRWQAGPALVNYIGHGSVEVWTGRELLTTGDALALTNGGQLPVVLAMTCLNGFFHDLYTESLAEGLLKAERGGAVAVWASSGLTDPEPQAHLNQVMVQGLFQGLTLGEAAIAAKASITDVDVRRTWILFGDPVTKLR